MITDPAEVRRLAEAKREENLHFRRYLHAHHHPIEPFQLLATEIEHRIDCTACANCCRHTTVGVTGDDIDAIAGFLNLTPPQVLEQYTEVEAPGAARRILLNRNDACVFLDGNLCMIYEARPGPCRRFPHVTPGTHSLGGRLESICRHAEICPILYNALEAYKHVVGYHPR